VVEISDFGVLKMELDLFTFITRNGADYAEYLKYTCEKNLSGQHKINWKYVESLDLKRPPSGYTCVGKSYGDGEHSSMKHAIAIEKALECIESDYVLFVDCDVAVLYKGWDNVIINELNKNDCFGGATSESKNKFDISRYKKFPKINFFSFRSDVLDKVELNFRPFREGVFKEKIPPKYSKYLNIKNEYDISYDIGWRLPIIFKRNNLKYSYMPCYLWESKESILPHMTDEKIKLKKNKRSEEWHYKGQLFAAHKKFGRSHDLNGVWGDVWKRRIDLYIKEYK
jgi:hypothetical protein